MKYVLLARCPREVGDGPPIHRWFIAANGTDWQGMDWNLLLGMVAIWRRSNPYCELQAVRFPWPRT